MVRVSSGVTAVFMLLWRLLVILLRPRSIRVVGVSIRVARVIPVRSIRGRVRTVRQALLAVLGRILGHGIRPVSIVLAGRAI